MIRPRRTGKTFFGKMWYEYFKGNSKLLKDTAIYKTGTIPAPGEYVTVNLDFSLASVEDIASYITEKYNIALKNLGIRTIEGNPGSVLSVNSKFNNILEFEGKRAAIFVDEYDSLVMSSTDYYESRKLTESYFKSLKAIRDRVPCVFITGSSRITMSEFWSGANSIVDLSYEIPWATAFGYTWEDIENLYEPQLKLIEKLYEVDRLTLRKKLEDVYNGYNFCPDQSKTVFNVLAINNFIRFAKFDPYFSMTGLTCVLKEGILNSATINLLSRPNVRIPADMIFIKSWKYDFNGR
jgi:hypothetical protein